MLSCLRVAQVICESLQFVSFEVVVVSQHKVLHRTPRPPCIAIIIKSLFFRIQIGKKTVQVICDLVDILLSSQHGCRGRNQILLGADLAINHCAYNFFRNM
jgi:hypothetical protein